MGSDTKDTIVLGKQSVSAEKEAAYRAQIKAARQGGVNSLKGNDPLGHVAKPQIPYLQPQHTAPEISPLTPEGGVQPRPPGSPAIRPETLKQVAEFAAASKKEVEEAKAKADKEEADENLFDDILDMDARTEAEKILNNKIRRKDIESRCAPMNIEDLILKDEVRQRVPIIPDKFEVEFRSLTSQENLFIKQFIAKETTTTDMYLLEKLGICQLTCAVVSVNGKALPDHRDSDGQVKNDLFLEKFKRLSKMSGYIVTDLGLNYMWFDLRVRKLINPEVLGNG